MFEHNQSRRKEGDAFVADHFPGGVSEDLLGALIKGFDPPFEVAGDGACEVGLTHGHSPFKLSCAIITRWKCTVAKI